MHTSAGDAVQAGSDPPASRRSVGIVATLAQPVVAAVARAAEAGGYHTLWANDGPDGEGLAALSAAAEATTALRLGVGLIPLDLRAPEQIAARIAELRLPVERLVVGVGSGGTPGGLARVRDGVAALRGLTRAPVVVGALGPKMLGLAVAVADGVLLDWPTPTHARAVREEIGRAAAAEDRSPPRVAGYVFTALGAAGMARLRADAAYYGAVPAYAAHFRRMGAAPMDAAVAGAAPEHVRHGLSVFDAALDETVVRATVGEETVDAYLEVLAAAAPG
jgi:alkanesulfonate monooxygenase SsuD/methylene tetrahydromethanopterin reductase-like flavin-dependent oxidoreductase (luciferase family)